MYPPGPIRSMGKTTTNSALRGAMATARRVPEAVWVAALLVVAQLPLLDRTLVTLDEGQATAIGHRLASGEALYRDIHTGVFPGLYWLVEALFRAFGTEILVLRWAQLAVNTSTAVLLFLLARPLARGCVAWFAPIGYWVLVVVSFPAFTILTYSPLSLLAALGALVFCHRYVVGARVLDGIATGVLLGVATIAKQNFGGLALLAVLAAALWTRREGRLAAVPPYRAFGIPMAAGAAVAILAAARLVSSGAWHAFFEATFVTIVASQLDAFNQPLPPVLGPHPAGGVFYFLYGPGGMFGQMFQGDPLATPTTISAATRIGYGSAYLALALAPLLAWQLGRHRDEQVRIAARIILPFAVLFFLGIFPSAIWSHLAAVYPPLLVILAAGLSLGITALDCRSALTGRFARYTVVAVTMLVVAFTARLELGIRRAFAEPLLLPSAGVHVAPRDARLYRAADEFLRRCAPPGEPVFVGPYMPILYVTSGRANATPYDLLISIDVKETVVIERMESAGVNCVVFNPQMYVQFPPFERTFPKLAAYLSEEFAETGYVIAEDAKWVFLRRRPLPEPEQPS